MKNIHEKFTLLTETFDIPEFRRDTSKPSNIRWLMRNIQIRNFNEENLRDAVSLLKNMLSHRQAP